MPSPVQQLARIQPTKQELPSLETMRADLIKLETDKSQPPLVRMLAGMQRTLTDYMRLIIAGQKKHAETVKGEFQTLVAEIQALLAPEPAPETPAEPQTEQAPAPVEPVVQVAPEVTQTAADQAAPPKPPKSKKAVSQ